jgi:hypothetical protein
VAHAKAIRELESKPEFSWKLQSYSALANPRLDPDCPAGQRCEPG